MNITKLVLILSFLMVAVATSACSPRSMDSFINTWDRTIGDDYRRQRR